jgi:bifunctional DNA-binding transcriptional regulator/antitoxin component of YhaV-PrlF toxin-antitoxin module
MHAGKDQVASGGYAGCSTCQERAAHLQAIARGGDPLTVTIISDKDGRLTIPAEVRAAPRIEGKAPWAAEAIDGALVLRPAIVEPREDAWAYTPEHAVEMEELRRSASQGASRA